MSDHMLDNLHRGYTAYLKATGNSTDCDMLRRLILRTDRTGEQYNGTLRTCKIETDWIGKIEIALPFIERAVRENRQFIRRTGDTVPIEKVRRVSKTSVEHLARHSELISRVPESGDELIPDKLLMTENVSTYTVYENRFLYMLLCYVKDFAGIRLSGIAEHACLFASELVFDKNIFEKGKKISFSLRYKETSSASDQFELSREVADCLARIRNVIAAVDTLLKTGLMVEVSTAPMLKPPVARTNVLLQNPCFAAAMELYDYLSAYTGDGYTQKNIYSTHGEMSDAARADYAELVAITSYLSHRHGGFYDVLEESYRKAEAEREKAAQKAAQVRINALKASLGDDLPPSAVEYIFALEKKCRQADAERDQHLSEIERLRADEEKRVQTERVCAAMASELNEMKDSLRRREALDRENAEKHRRALDEAADRILQKENEQARTVARYEAELEKLTAHFEAEYTALAEQYHLQKARLHAQNAASTPVSDHDEEDFSSKEAFAELEAEYRAFKRFFETQWKRAKKRIRRDRLWKKSDR